MNFIIILLYYVYSAYLNFIGDWGLGIGPNPQSPIPKKIIVLFIIY